MGRGFWSFQDLPEGRKCEPVSPMGNLKAKFFCVLQYVVTLLTKPAMKSAALADVTWYCLFYWTQNGSGSSKEHMKLADSEDGRTIGTWIPQRWMRLRLCPWELLFNSRGDWDVCTKFILTQSRMTLVLQWWNRVLQQYRSGTDSEWGFGKASGRREKLRLHGFRK